MLSKKTVDLCIKKLDEEYRILLRRTENNEIWQALVGKDLYVYEEALAELKNELQIIEEENLSD